MMSHRSERHDQGQPKGREPATRRLSEFTEGELKAFVAGYVCACTDDCEVESVLEGMGHPDLAECVRGALAGSATSRLVASLWPKD